MTAPYLRTSRAKPSGGGGETFIWYLMRLSAVALFVLAVSHFLIVHVVYDPSGQTAKWIESARWSNVFWRVFDWLLLMTVLLHAFLGVRTVVSDYVKGGWRTAAMMALFLVGVILFAAGTMVVATLPGLSVPVV